VLDLRSSVAQPLETLPYRLEIHVVRVAHVGAQAESQGHVEEQGEDQD
jgi:hypothetical protein